MDDWWFAFGLAALFAIVGVIMWYLDSPMAFLGAQRSALEGMILALGGTIIAAASLVKVKRKGP